jgi:hypothetical protein
MGRKMGRHYTTNVYVLGFAIAAVVSCAFALNARANDFLRGAPGTIRIYCTAYQNHSGPKDECEVRYNDAFVDSVMFEAKWSDKDKPQYYLPEAFHAALQSAETLAQNDGRCLKVDLDQLAKLKGLTGVPLSQYNNIPYVFSECDPDETK